MSLPPRLLPLVLTLQLAWNPTRRPMVADSPWEGAPAAGGAWALPETQACRRGGQGWPQTQVETHAGQQSTPSAWDTTPQGGQAQPTTRPHPSTEEQPLGCTWEPQSPVPTTRDTGGRRGRLRVHADSERHEPHMYTPHTQAGGCVPHKDHTCPQMCGHATAHTWVHTRREAGPQPCPAHSLASRPLCPLWASASL